MKTVTPIPKPNHLVQYWKKEWKILFLVVVSGLLCNGLMSLGPVWLGKLIDAIANHQTQADILRVIEIYFGIILLLQGSRVVKRYTVRVFANRTGATMRFMIYNNLIHKPVQEIESQRAGDLMNRAIADVDIAVEGMRKVTTEIFDTGVLMIGYIITLFLYDASIAFFACLFIPAAMGLAALLKKTVTHANQMARKDSSLVADSTFERTQNMMLYRMNGCSEAQDEDYEKQLLALEKSSVKADVLETSMQPIYNAITMLGTIIVFYFGTKNIFSGTWTLGIFTTFLTIFTAFAFKASKASRLFNSYQKAKVSWQRIQNYFQEYQSQEPSEPLEPVKDFMVKDLSFSWTKDQEYISGFSIEAKAGEIIGITGPIACGKSTLAMALTGRDGFEGEVRLNQSSLKQFRPTTKSQAVTVMEHNPMLLSDTIEKNIQLGKAGDVTQALQDAMLLEEVQEMPEGIHTKVGSNGVRLSGGQQQRLALARILYHHSQVMILDDPFASVDPQTEQKIFSNLRQHYPESILFITSHRLDTFAQMDQVIFMQDGKHFTIGTHEELLQLPAYQKLVHPEKEETHA